MEVSYKGKTSEIIVGALEKIYHSRQKQGFKIITYKVNQSGASSKEVGDVDIFKGDPFLYAV